MEIKLEIFNLIAVEPWSSMVFLGKERENGEKVERIEFGWGVSFV